MPSTRMSLEADSSQEPPVNAEPLDTLRLVLGDLGQRIQLQNPFFCRTLHYWALTFHLLSLPPCNFGFSYFLILKTASDSSQKFLDPPPTPTPHPTSRVLTFPVPTGTGTLILFPLSHCHHHSHTLVGLTSVHPKYTLPPTQEDISLCPV